MKVALTAFALCVLSFTQLFAQQSSGNLDFGIGVNAGSLRSPILGLEPQASFGVSLTARPHERVSLSLSVAHASSRTEASSQALSFIGASNQNFQSTSVDFAAYLRCWNLNEHVGFYAGFGMNHLWSDFQYLYFVETGETSFDIVSVNQEQIKGARTAGLATFALRSNAAARVQVALFGYVGLLATRPEISSFSFAIFDQNGNRQSSTNTPGPTRYVRAGVEVSYRIRK